MSLKVSAAACHWRKVSASSAACRSQPYAESGCPSCRQAAAISSDRSNPTAPLAGIAFSWRSRARCRSSRVGSSLGARIPAPSMPFERVPDVRRAAATPYTDIPGWDSLSQINVIFEVEKSFAVRFDDDELEELRASATFGELQALLRMKLSQGEARSA